MWRTERLRPELVSCKDIAHLFAADSTDTTASDQTTASKTDSTSQTNTAKDSSSTDSSSKTDTATGTAKKTGTQTGTGTTTGTSTGKSSKTTTSSISIDPRLPAGGISMLIPTAGATTYYRIGQYVTFAWNYTSLIVTPTAVNVLATCTMNQATYTLSSNMSVEATGKVVWDTGEYQANATVPLLTATYTLYVVDVDKDIGDVASAGHLGSQIGYPFGMYLPQPYTPLNGMLLFPMHFDIVLTRIRIQLRHVQQRPLRDRATSPEVRLWHGHYHHSVLHLVRRWLWCLVHLNFLMNVSNVFQQHIALE